MRRSFATYQPVVADDKWVPKADRKLMEEERLRERALLLQRKIPTTSTVV
jgi:hypothetical protein